MAVTCPRPTPTRLLALRVVGASRGWGHRPESPRPSLGQENRGVGGGGRVFLAAGAQACTKG